MADWGLDIECFYLGQPRRGFTQTCAIQAARYQDHNTRIRAESALRQARLWSPKPPVRGTPIFADTSFVFSPYIPVTYGL